MNADPYAKSRAAVESAVAEAIREVLQDAEQNPGSESTFAQASWLTDFCQDATNVSGKIRASLLLQIQQAGNLSLAQLGDKVGISKARADQITRSARGIGRKERKAT